MLFIKSVAIGFSIAAPVGSIGLLCIPTKPEAWVLLRLCNGHRCACADLRTCRWLCPTPGAAFCDGNDLIEVHAKLLRSKYCGPINKGDVMNGI